MGASDEWFPEGYSPEISNKDWLALLRDKDVCKEESLILLKCLKDSGGAASCKQLSLKYGRHAQAYNLAGSRLAKKVALKTGCPVLERENGEPAWWPVVFLGRRDEASPHGEFIWKLRPELSQALDSYDLSAVPLYGMTELKDEYQRAAEMLMEIATEKGIGIAQIAQDAEQQRLDFVERFSPEKLRAIPEDKLLATLYLTQPSSKDYMMYHLEAKTESWGSIWGGSSHKFGLFQREVDHFWVNGSGQLLTQDEAFAHACDVREKLIQGAHFFETFDPSNRKELDNLDAVLQGILGKSYSNIWIQKYFALLYPNKVSGFYSYAWQNHVLYACNIVPNNKTFSRSSQIAMIANHNDWQYPEFFHVFESRFGKTLKKFYRLEPQICGLQDLKKLQNESIIAIGWSKIGTLFNEQKGKIFNRKELTNRLQKNYYPQDRRLSASRASELLTFSTAPDSSVFVVSDGEKPLALVDNIGSYLYRDDASPAHCRHGEWHMAFGNDERLPDAAEGLSTSCIELKNPNNIFYLYNKYFDLDIDEQIPFRVQPAPVRKNIDFQLSFPPSEFPKNRIIFGAPGTGKSHKLKNDAEGYFGPNIERVTFHPEYSYANFMGCYKPQTTREGAIRYGFVPGPFLRVLVRALRSGMEGNPQPHLLLIEEINRARVAAVFGDAFQLLDRVEEGYSEYDIAVSEDVKEYLSRELGCVPGECERIRIPGNMFIWATMNSADQGVFPMDTAFKRRWSFEYLPIDPPNPPDVRIAMKINAAMADISWNELRGAINDRLSGLHINEDKLIGPYFLKPSVLEGDENGRIKNSEGFNDVFKNKILMYLFEDAGRQRRPEVFRGCADHHRYSSLCREFDERGLAIFGENFVNTFSKKPS